MLGRSIWLDFDRAEMIEGMVAKMEALAAAGNAPYRSSDDARATGHPWSCDMDLMAA
jgi:hypothetical protein